MKRAIIFGVIILVFGAVGYKVKVKLEQNRLQQTTAQQGSQGFSIPLVKTLEVTPQPIRETMELVGSIKAETEISVQPRISGRLILLAVEEGQEVTKGDLIGVIDDETLKLQIQQIEATITGLKANQNQAELNVARLKSQKERYRELLDKRYISQWEYEQSEKDYLGAEASLANIKGQLLTAEKNYELQEMQLKQTRIYAPVSGFILQKQVTVGVNLTSGTTIVTMASLTPVKLTFSIDQKDATKIRKGMAVNFISDALPGQVFSGSVDRIAPIYDPKTRTLGLSVNLPNKDRNLVPGMFGTASILIGGKDFTLVTPQEAIVVQENQPGVFVVGKEATVRFKPVKTGLIAEGQVEVVSGLKTGDLVVVVGQNRLRDGQKVEVFGATGNGHGGRQQKLKERLNPDKTNGERKRSRKAGDAG